MAKQFQTHKGFYIGDICYVLTAEQYDNMWASQNYDDGEYTTNNHDWAVHSTTYGDGLYYGGNHKFCVDAGVIGILPLELITDSQKLKEAKSLGLVIEGELFANFEADSNGCFDVEIYDKNNNTIKKFDINTCGDYDDEDDDYHDEDWDDEGE